MTSQPDNQPGKIIPDGSDIAPAPIHCCQIGKLIDIIADNNLSQPRSTWRTIMLQDFWRLFGDYSNLHRTSENHSGRFTDTEFTGYSDYVLTTIGNQPFDLAAQRKKIRHTLTQKEFAEEISRIAPTKIMQEFLVEETSWEFDEKSREHKEKPTFETYLNDKNELKVRKIMIYDFGWPDDERHASFLSGMARLDAHDYAPAILEYFEELEITHRLAYIWSQEYGVHYPYKKDDATYKTASASKDCESPSIGHPNPTEKLVRSHPGRSANKTTQLAEEIFEQEYLNCLPTRPNYSAIARTIISRIKTENPELPIASIDRLARLFSQMHRKKR